MVRRSTKYLCLAFCDEKKFATLTEVDMAAIAAVHAESPDAASMRDGPQAGLTRIDAILAHGDLLDYRLTHFACADLRRRLGRAADARRAYERALSLTGHEPERRFLEGQLRDS